MTVRAHAELIILTALSLLVASPSLGDARIGQGAVDAVRAAPAARVIIMFDVVPSESDARPGFFVSQSGREAIRQVRQRVLAAIPPDEFELVRYYQTVNAVAGKITQRGLAALAAEPAVLRVDLDMRGRVALAESVPLANLDDAHVAGYTGIGTTVAIIDTGYDSDHPDLADDLVAEACFCDGGCCPGGSSTQSGPGSAEDDHGHGSHVAGIITSMGAVASVGGAPDAEVVAVKAVADDGTFQTSDLIAGLDWVAANHPQVDAVTVSLSTFLSFAGECDDASSSSMALATVIDNLRSLGVPVFAASGNSGSGTQMSEPACVANAISVGAVYDADIGEEATYCLDLTTAPDQVTCFSNTNRTTDLFAPGAAITSAHLGGGLLTFGGTSQAAAHAAACAALLRQAEPGVSPAAIEAALEGSPVQVTDATNGLAFPRLDCEDALVRIRIVFSDDFESGNDVAWSSSLGSRDPAVWVQDDIDTSDSYDVSSEVVANDFTLAEAMLISSFEAVLVDGTGVPNSYLDNFGGTLSWAIYDDHPGTGRPRNLVATGSSSLTSLLDTGLDDFWNDDIFVARVDLDAPVSLGSGTYWLALHEGEWTSPYDGTVIYWSTVGETLILAAEKTTTAPGDWTEESADTAFALFGAPP